MSLTVALTRLSHGADLPLPAYASAGAAGLDLMAALGAGETLELMPGKRAQVPTGIAIALPEGYEAQIRPRSGLAARHGVTLVNTPGTVDSDYRGEVCVLMINLGEAPVTFRHGDRIAQMVVAPVTRIAFEEIDELPTSERGGGGFGSTGISGAPSRKEAP